jgi:hypothetical protein
LLLIYLLCEVNFGSGPYVGFKNEPIEKLFHIIFKYQEMQLSSSVHLENNYKKKQMMAIHQKVQLRSSFDFIIHFRKETGDASRPKAATKIEPMLKMPKMNKPCLHVKRSS